MTTETPEYKEAYEKEMQRLEAEATSKGKPEVKVETTSKVDEGEKPKTEAKGPTAEELAAQLKEEKDAREKLEKSLKDTQRWGHGLANKVSQLEKDRKEEKHAAAKPAILDANPGLEAAIKHVARVETVEQAPQEAWMQTVSRAIPDVEALLGDKDFYAKAAAKKTELGSEWDDPINAIRELSTLKAAHNQQQNLTAAVESARKDFEAKAKKKSAMEVPGGSGGKDAKAEVNDDAKRYQTMSTAEFAKERSRVMGY